MDTKNCPKFQKLKKMTQQEKSQQESSFLLQNPLQTSLVLDNVLSLLPVSTVKTGRLVSKSWAREGFSQLLKRSVLVYKEPLLMTYDPQNHFHFIFLENLQWKSLDAETGRQPIYGEEYRLCQLYCYGEYIDRLNPDRARAHPYTPPAKFPILPCPGLSLAHVAPQITRLNVSNLISTAELNQFLDCLPKISILEFRAGLSLHCSGCGKMLKERKLETVELLNTRWLSGRLENINENFVGLGERLEKNVKEIHLNYAIVGQAARQRILTFDPKLTVLQVRSLQLGGDSRSMSYGYKEKENVSAFVSQLLTCVRSTKVGHLSWKISRLTIHLTHDRHKNESVDPHFLGHLRHFMESPLVVPHLTFLEVTGQLCPMTEEEEEVDDPSKWIIPGENVERLTDLCIRPECDHKFEVENEAANFQHQNWVMSRIFVSALRIPGLKGLKVKKKWWYSCPGYEKFSFEDAISKWDLDLTKLESLDLDYAVANVLKVVWPNVREFEGLLRLHDNHVVDSVRRIFTSLPKLKRLTLRLDCTIGYRKIDSGRSWDELLTGKSKKDCSHSAETNEPPSIKNLSNLTSLKISPDGTYFENVNFLTDFFIKHGLLYLHNLQGVYISCHKFSPDAVNEVKLLLGKSGCTDFQNHPKLDEL